MGNLGSSLLEAIGVGGSQGANPLAAYGGLESNPGMKMFGMENAIGRGGISEAGAIPTNAPTPQEAAMDEAIVTGFKPEKMNFWKRLADQFLIHQGQQPVMEKKVYKKNMERAMEGFTRDPLETIRRIGTFDPQTAMTLYNTYVDNKRQDVQAQRVQQMMEERTRDRAAAILGAATPENFDKIKGIAGNYLRSHGMDDSDLPATYDDINAYRYGAVDVDKQMDNSRDAAAKADLSSYRQERLGQMQQTIEDRRSNQQGTLSERQRHNKAMENRPRSGPGKNPRGGTVYKDSSGSLIEYNKDGSKIKVTQPSGRIVYYGFDANGKRVRIGVKEKE